MPDEAMTDNGHAVLFTIFYYGIGSTEIISAFFWVNIYAFHAVFCNDRVEVLFYEPCCRTVFTGYLPGVQCYANKELVTERLFQG